MQNGQKQLTPYFQSTGGLNTSDSVFTVKETQATGGFNYEYVRTGGIMKSLCPSRTNIVANAQLRTLGLFLRHTQAGVKTIVRAAGTKIQLTDLEGTFTNLSDDTLSPNSDFIPAGAVQPVVGSMFISPIIDSLWLFGGNMGLPRGVVSPSGTSNATASSQGLTYTAVADDSTGNSISITLSAGGTAGSEVVSVVGSAISVLIESGVSMTSDVAAAISSYAPAASLVSVSYLAITSVSPAGPVVLSGGGVAPASITQVTLNGADAPKGAVSVTDVTDTLGDWPAVGVYYYAFAYRKKSTQTLSNAGLDVKFTLANITDTALINFTGLSNLDTTKYDAIYVFRSALAGVSGFTTGDLAAIVDVTDPAYTGTYSDNGRAFASAQNVPRPGNVVLDNSVLPPGMYNVGTMWKRRLVAAKGNQVYISELDKPESWPLTNLIPIPSGGPITAVAIISFTPDAVSTDEFLAIFKETEVWVLSGNDFTDWRLKFVDFCGTLSQPSVISSTGYLYFLDNRGVYMWNGSGKPHYLSRPIEDLFGTNGTLDRSKLPFANGVFFRRQNEVVWYLSDNDVGEQTYVLKMDLRLTLPQVTSILSQPITDGVFLQGKLTNPVYASAAFIFPTSSNQEDLLITGDAAGYCYRQFYSTTGVGAADFDFTYDTPYLNCQRPNTNKQFYTVYAWVENVGNWDLLLDYWTDYRAAEGDKHTCAATISDNTNGSTALWDVAKWDQALWDGFTSKPTRMVFNLVSSPYNNSVGEVIKLRFRNQGSDEPLTIYGFALSWAEVAQAK